MADKGILFTHENRDKVRSGAKTQTRRVIVWPKMWKDFKCISCRDLGDGRFSFWAGDSSSFVMKTRCAVGDRMYLREPYHLKGVDDNSCDVVYSDDSGTCTYVELDSEGVEQMLKIMRRDASRCFLGYHPSIHMPKVLARTWFEVTGVRVERVQDISLEDIIAEGIRLPQEAMRPASIMTDKGILESLAKPAFILLWDSINGTKYPWKTNPFVWCYSFERVEK